MIWYQGEIKGGAMHFASEHIRKDGTKQLARVTLTPLPDGRVRHHIEVSDDQGKTWAVGFDGIYVRKKSPAP